MLLYTKLLNYVSQISFSINYIHPLTEIKYKNVKNSNVKYQTFFTHIFAI